MAPCRYDSLSWSDYNFLLDVVGIWPELGAVAAPGLGETDTERAGAPYFITLWTDMGMGGVHTLLTILARQLDDDMVSSANSSLSSRASILAASHQALFHTSPWSPSRGWWNC